LEQFCKTHKPAHHQSFVLANGSMSSGIVTEAKIRKTMIEADLVDCMASLPSQLFYNTQIPVCLWFLVRNKPNLRAMARHCPSETSLTKFCLLMALS
jgi:type I restriction enzyme M protein